MVGGTRSKTYLPIPAPPPKAPKAPKTPKAPKVKNDQQVGKRSAAPQAKAPPSKSGPKGVQKITKKGEKSPGDPKPKELPSKGGKKGGEQGGKTKGGTKGGTEKSPPPGESGHQVPSRGGTGDQPPTGKESFKAPDGTSGSKTAGTGAGTDAEAPASSTARRRTTDRVAKSVSKQQRSGIAKGLNNSGNWCYRNALLQCFLHQPAYCDVLEDIHQECTTKRCVVCALKKMANIYWAPALDEVARTANATRLTEIAAELDRAMVHSTRHADDETVRADIRDLRQTCPMDFLTNFFVDELTKDRDDPDETRRVNEVFGSAWTEVWHCKFCRKEHQRTDPVQEVGLDIKIVVPRQNLPLNVYLQNHFVDPNRTPACDCKKANQERKKNKEGKWPTQTTLTYLTAWPDILCIRIQRFTTDENHVTRKMMNEVPFDEYINLGPYTTNKEDLLYRLDGVASHSGNVLHSGHYISGVRDLSGKSFHFVNDGTVRKVPPAYNTANALQHPSGTGINGQGNYTPYILVYSRY